MRRKRPLDSRGGFIALERPDVLAAVLNELA